MRYTGKKTTEISFPIGGIGTGSIGLGGDGRLVDWEIYNRPAKGSHNYYSHFAVKAEADGKVLDARVLHGDIQGSRMGPVMRGSHIGFGFGPHCFTMGGLPHFRNTEFNGEFPIATMDFSDEHFPGKVQLTAFNPFIPLNEDDSSIPAAFFEIAITNLSGKTIDYTAAFSVKNPFKKQAVNRYHKEDGISHIYLYQKEYDEDDINYGDLCIATDAEDLSYQEAWYRAGWRDDYITFWRNFTTFGPLQPRSYADDGKNGENGGDHGTLAVKLSIEPGSSKKVRFLISWNNPNCYNYWLPYKETVNGVEKDVTWKNYYAKLFKNSIASADYAFKNWDRLYNDTKRFKDEFFAQTLPGKTIEAASCGLPVLKSPTVMRLENGELYGWEGLMELEGACEGTCTHVWNFAYALPFLFPRLERSIRDLDYKYNWREDGKLEFRMALPLGRQGVPFHACVDGQMGGIIKCYREWKICGDDEWLKKNWEHIKGALEYAWAPTNPDKWDLDKDGILEGRQHNTLDTELFTASPWLEGFYVAALRAASIMADYLGEKDKAEEYMALSLNGQKYIEENLFNGKYYFQKVDLNDRSLLDRFADDKEIEGCWNEETNEIKYQIGEGSEIDQMAAQWHADIVGLGDIFDPERVKIATESMYHNNFKKCIREVYNPWRLFCIDDEAGAIICDYPEGVRKPSIPMSYAEETMHGFEYMMAALLIAHGHIDMGLEVIAGVRDRYDGEYRNPFNEIENGSNYARSMASYSYIPLFQGFEFDMVKGMLGFKPLLKGYFRGVWSLDPAWGNVICDDDYINVNIISGKIALNELRIPFESVASVTVDGRELSADEYTLDGRAVKFNDTVNFTESVMVRKA